MPLLLATLVGTGISGYLAVLRLIGEVAACGPSGGCATVQTSEYAVLFGVVPVAFLGFGMSVVLVVLAVTWWRRADRRALLGMYALLLLSTAFVAYLTYLELFVIEAICPWCVSYAITTIVALLLAALAMRKSSAAA